jgi:hypothetical protein
MRSLSGEWCGDKHKKHLPDLDKGYETRILY